MADPKDLNPGDPALTDPNPVDPKPTDPETKTFTQDELDNIVKSRLSKEQEKHQKKMREVLEKLGVEDEQQIEQIVERVKTAANLEEEVVALKTEKEKNQKVEKLRNLDVDEDFLEFVLGKVDGENFEAMAEQFVKDNPKFTKEHFSSIDSGLNLKGGSRPDFEQMTTEEYLKWREKNSL